MDKESSLKLRDGRNLAYTEHGDPNGKPVLFIHGNPGSRYVRHPDASIAQTIGARIITPDRPGYGKSDFQPKRTLLDYPDDIAQLMDSLGVEKFAVMGVSAGGPHTAATAYKLANRITRTAIVSSAAPLDRENAYENVHPSMKSAFKLVQVLPDWLALMILGRQNKKQTQDPEKSLNERGAMLSEFDQNMLRNPAVRAQVLGYRKEAVRNGIKGTLREMQLLASPWGFKLSDIRGEVYVWHWEGDFLTPIQMGKYIAGQIPNAKAHFLPGGGHYSIFDQWAEILAILTAP